MKRAVFRSFTGTELYLPRYQWNYDVEPELVFVGGILQTPGDDYVVDYQCGINKLHDQLFIKFNKRYYLPTTVQVVGELDEWN